MDTATSSGKSTTPTVVTSNKYPRRRSNIYQLCNNCTETERHDLLHVKCNSSFFKLLNGIKLGFISCNKRNRGFIQFLRREHFSSIVGVHQFKLKMEYRVLSYRWLLRAELRGFIAPEDNNFNVTVLQNLISLMLFFSFKSVTIKGVNFCLKIKCNLTI